MNSTSPRIYACIGALLILSFGAGADDAVPTAYEIMKELRQAAITECSANGPSCKAFTDIQRQLGQYIEAACRSLALTSDECARTPIVALLNVPLSSNDPVTGDRS